jgi:hypothetical protein
MGRDHLRAALEAVAALLEDGLDSRASLVRDALLGSEQSLEDFLSANELWGGAGSIADEALIEKRELRQSLELSLLLLGKEQLARGNANERTQMWVSAFEQWAHRL